MTSIEWWWWRWITGGVDEYDEVVDWVEKWRRSGLADDWWSEMDNGSTVYRRGRVTRRRTRMTRWGIRCRSGDEMVQRMTDGGEWAAAWQAEGMDGDERWEGREEDWVVTARSVSSLHALFQLILTPRNKTALIFNCWCIKFKSQRHETERLKINLCIRFFFFFYQCLFGKLLAQKAVYIILIRYI